MASYHCKRCGSLIKHTPSGQSENWRVPTVCASCVGQTRRRVAPDIEAPAPIETQLAEVPKVDD